MLSYDSEFLCYVVLGSDLIVYDLDSRGGIVSLPSISSMDLDRLLFQLHCTLGMVLLKYFVISLFVDACCEDSAH